MLKLLTAKMPELSPAQKYALCCIVRLSKKQRAVYYSVAELSARLGVKTHVVRSVVAGFLVQKGYLSKHVASATTLPGQARRGRPNCNYRYAVDFDGSFQRETVPGETTHHLELVKVIMDTRCGGRLSPAETVLLSTLLRFADMSGAVRTLGLAALRDLVGVKRSNLISMLDGLKSKNLLLARSPGGTSSRHFGKVKSLYILNIETLYHNAGMGGTKCPYRIRTYVIPSPPIDLVRRSLKLLMDLDKLSRGVNRERRIGRETVAKGLERRVTILKSDLSVILDIDLDKISVIDQLKLPMSQVDVDLMQQKLEEYACELSREGKGEVGKFVRGDYEAVRAHIRSDIESVGSAQFTADAENCIYWMAVRLAELLHARAYRIDPNTEDRVEQAATLEASFDAITLLPAAKHDEYRQLVVTKKK